MGSRLSMKRALRAAKGMEFALSGMVDYLHDKFYDETEIVTDVKSVEGVLYQFKRSKVSLKEKTAIASFFARTLSLKNQVEEELGLRHKDQQAGSPLVIALGGNVAVFKSLPSEKRQEIILKLARGEKVEVPSGQSSS